MNTEMKKNAAQVNRPASPALIRILAIYPETDEYQTVYVHDTDHSIPGSGCFSEKVRTVADTQVHPADRQRFLDFWKTERITGELREQGNQGGLVLTYRQKNGTDYEQVREHVVLAAEDEQSIVILSFTQVQETAGSRPSRSGDTTERKCIRSSLPDHPEMMKLYSAWLDKCSDREIAVAAIDINYFKLYNDVYGWQAGSRLLRHMSSVIGDFATRSNGIAGYFGGDNFALVFGTGTIGGVNAAKERIEREIDRFLDKRGFAPACGIYVTTDHTKPFSELYERALTALAEIKGNYTEHTRIFDKRRYQVFRDRQIMLSNVLRDLNAGNFDFYLQPKVDMNSGRISSAEALVRWIRGDTAVTPQHFIGDLEQSGYIYILDRYVWNGVCAYQKSLLESGIRPLPVSVNVSRADFYFTDVAQHFAELMRRYTLDPSYIQIEITESAYADDSGRSIQDNVDRLRSMGHTILMDDFGVGYSSLMALRDLRVDIIKIDKEFLQNLKSGGKDLSIIDSVINMAHMMDIRVIAEGVETKEQVDFLLSHGCNYAQGYYFYKAMPRGQFTELIRNEDNVQRKIVSYAPARISRLNVRDLLNQGLLEDDVLGNMLGAAAVVELSDDSMELIQMNDEYCRLTGIRRDDAAGRKKLLDRIDLPREKLREQIMQAEEAPAGIGPLRHVFHRSDGREVLTDTKIFRISEYGGKKLFLLLTHEAA